MSTAGVTLRRFDGDDLPAVLALLSRSLGWLGDDHHAAFFAWKHGDNPFGPSPAWVAVDGGGVVGFRAFLRWEFEQGGEVRRAVRAVDTATAPEHRGRGVFRALTLHGLDELRADGVDFVFNTPNSQSAPGYLKMGWEPVGRLPVSARPRSWTPGGVRAMAGARTPAELWSQPTAAGVPAAEALADTAAVAFLLASARGAGGNGLRSRRSPAYLAWRYAGFVPLGYRALTIGADVADGLALFRVRRRGRSLEAVLGDVLAPAGDRRIAARLALAVLRATGADHAVACGLPGAALAGFAPLPRSGPLLTWRGLARDRRPSRAGWRLTLGDVELF